MPQYPSISAPNHGARRDRARVVAGTLVVAEQGVAPADTVEQIGLFCPMADGLVKAQRLFRMSQDVGVAVLNLG